VRPKTRLIGFDELIETYKIYNVNKKAQIIGGARVVRF
jgi:hypothetical protein